MNRVNWTDRLPTDCLCAVQLTPTDRQCDPHKSDRSPMPQPPAPVMLSLGWSTARMTANVRSQTSTHLDTSPGRRGKGQPSALRTSGAGAWGGTKHWQHRLSASTEGALVVNNQLLVVLGELDVLRLT